jgi:hypothetical protein
MIITVIDRAEAAKERFLTAGKDEDFSRFDGGIL